ncbi:MULTISPECIES: hypothetical protein [Streptomyces]|nr:hypothetical protein [Streptomyces glaucescens]
MAPRRYAPRGRRAPAPTQEVLGVLVAGAREHTRPLVVRLPDRAVRRATA